MGYDKLEICKRILQRKCSILRISIIYENGIWLKSSKKGSGRFFEIFLYIKFK